MIVSPTIVLVDPTADLQGAIDDAPDYSTIRLAPGVYTAPDAGGFVIDHPITIEGAGRPYVFDGIGPPKVAWSEGTVIRVYNAAGTTNGGMNSRAFTIQAPTSAGLHCVTIRSLGIENPYTIPASPVTAGTGDGIYVDCSIGAVSRLTVEDVSILFMGRDGINVDGDLAGGRPLDQSTFRHVDISGSRRHGMRIDYGTDIDLDRVTFTGNEQCGLYVSSSYFILSRHCLWNNNGKSFVTAGTDWNGDPAAWPYYNQAQCVFNGTTRLAVEAGDFEEWAQLTSGTEPAVKTAIQLLSSHSGVIQNCGSYNSGGYAAGAVDTIFIMLSDASGNSILSNQVAACDWYVYGLENAGVRGNFVGPFYPSVPNAPNKVQLPSRTEVTGLIAGDTVTNPSGGNFGMVMLARSTAIETNVIEETFLAGLQFPFASAVTAITSTPGDGTVAGDASAKALKLYQDGAWQTVAAGVVVYEGETVTHNDNVVSY